MQFRLITAILASAAISGVAAGSIQARQGELAKAEAPAAAPEDASLATTPEGSGSGTGAGNPLEAAQGAIQADQAVTPGGTGETPDLSASQFQIPGFGNIPGSGNINVNFQPPAKQDPKPPYNPYDPYYQYPYPGGYPAYSPGWCATYGYPPGCAYVPPPPPAQCPWNPLICNTWQCSNAFLWRDGNYYCGSNPNYGQTCKCTFPPAPPPW